MQLRCSEEKGEHQLVRRSLAESSIRPGAKTEDSPLPGNTLTGLFLVQMNVPLREWDRDPFIIESQFYLFVSLNSEVLREMLVNG
jgi:hypothetical protein